MPYLIESLRIWLTYALPLMMALGVGFVFIRVLMRLNKLDGRISRTEQELRNETNALSRSLGAFKGEIETLQATDKAPVSAGALNAATRAKILKLHRLGRPVEQISSSLHVPRGEVAMLLKVHAMVMRTLEPENDLTASTVEQKG
ncbi:MAG TPA: hypothetical protein VKU01_09710 [Bryobacteraceae bacterium]|nr:hypothetical protein [Bryobacteraceae bacterium]